MGRTPYAHRHLPPGIRARPKSGGVVWYYLDIGKQADGSRPEIALGKDYTEALRKYADLVTTAKAPPVTVPEILSRWQVQTIVGRAGGTQDDINYALPNLIKFFSDPSPAPLNQVKPLHIAQYLDWRRKAPVRANREISWLSAAWNWSRTRGLTDLPNPCDGVKRNKETGRDIYVEDDEMAAIKAKADVPLQEAIDLAHLIGQRPSDLRDILETDIRGGVLTLAQAKTGAKMAIEVSGELEALINRIKARKASIDGVRSLYLLCDETGHALRKAQLRYRFNKARTAAAKECTDPASAARIRAIQFRDLRAKSGTDKRASDGLDAAQALLGHTQSAMTESYTRARKGAVVKPVR